MSLIEVEVMPSAALFVKAAMVFERLVSELPPQDRVFMRLDYGVLDDGEHVDMLNLYCNMREALWRKAAEEVGLSFSKEEWEDWAFCELMTYERKAGAN
jgi:hypothetical protein